MDGQKYFFLQPKNDYFAYCSHCGKKVLQDSYNLHKHAEECGFGENGIFEILTEQDYCYRFEKESEDTLLFAVEAPRLVFRRGYKDRYEKGVWEKLYEARFHTNSREIEEKGLNSFNVWLFLLTQNKMMYSGTAEPKKVISSVFPVVPDVYSMLMFFQIYQTKGYKVIPFHASKEVENAFCRPRLKEQEASRSDAFHVYGNTLHIEDRVLLALRIYRYKLRTSEMRFSSMILGDGIYWAPENTDSPDLRKVWTVPVKCLIKEEELEEFIEKNPSFGIQNYRRDGGSNILIPLLCAGNYHKGVELFAKGGYALFADCFLGRREHLFDREPEPWEYTDAVKLLRLPKGLLKSMDHALLISEKTRKRIAHIYAANRPLIEGLQFNPSLIDFLLRNDVTKDHSVKNSYITDIRDYPDRDLRRILQYITTHDDAYEYYLDYLEMMQTTGIRDYGYCPADLTEAHNVLSREINRKKRMIDEAEFMHAVETYRYLESVDCDALKDDSFVMLVPDHPKALIKEGTDMHNCVASYYRRVLTGASKILFMRYRNAPEESFMTVEVQGNKLVQAKAKYNRKADLTCQEYVVKWCREKGIDCTRCGDIDNSAYSNAMQDMEETE